MRTFPLVDFRICHLPLATRHWQNPRHENIYPINYNSVSDIDRDFLICANDRLIARCIATQPCGSLSGQPNPQEMMKQMMEMSKLNENHKLLTDLDGNWTYTIKMWMNPDPNAPPQESKGTAIREIDDGWPLLDDGCDRQNEDAGTGRQNEGDDNSKGMESKATTM